MDDKKRKIIMTVSTLLVVVLIIAGVSYAYLRAEKEKAGPDITTADFAVIILDDLTAVNISNTLPMSDANGLKNTPTTFKIKNTSAVTASYQLSLIDNDTIISTLNNEDVRFQLIRKNESTGITDTLDIKNLPETGLIDEGIINAGVIYTYTLVMWVDYNANPQNTIFNKILLIEGIQAGGLDISGANSPKLSSTMIPIKWNGTKWVKADKTNTKNDWYNYNDKIWANAVTVKETGIKTREYYLNATEGIEIPEEDILTYFVWIPRYKYTIFNSGDGTSTPEQEIEIVFETGTTSTGTVNCTIADNGIETCTDTKNGSIINGTSTYTHPAFTFGSDEKTGFWVGKFETTGTIGTACTNVTCTTGSLTIKPDVTSLQSKTVSNMYYATISMNRSGNAYGFSSAEVDTHMMKNMEWGAVAYLTQSKYGRCTGGTCLEISINNSLGYYTGRSGGAPGGSNVTYASFFGTGGTEQYNTSGYYTYNDKKITCTGATCTYNSTIDNYTISEIKEEGKGTSASTTGNIYGIYDMSGGAYDYVMGNMVDGDGAFYPSSSGFNNTTIMYPESKYYDRYIYDASLSTTHNRGHLGDATRESLKTYGSTVGGWYSDYAVFPSSANSWLSRGGSYNFGTNAGPFLFYLGNGSANSYSGWRIVSHTK